MQATVKTDRASETVRLLDWSFNSQTGRIYKTNFAVSGRFQSLVSFALGDTSMIQGAVHRTALSTVNEISQEQFGSNNQWCDLEHPAIELDSPIRSLEEKLQL